MKKNRIFLYIISFLLYTISCKSNANLEDNNTLKNKTATKIKTLEKLGGKTNIKKAKSKKTKKKKQIKPINLKKI